MTTPLKLMDRLGEAKECWVLVNEYGAITNVRLTPPDDTKYPEQWRWQRFVAQDFAPNVNPLDREAWEARLKKIEARAEAATPGPWNWSWSYELPGGVHWCLENPERAGKATIDYSLVLVCDTPQKDMPKQPNWEFIAHSRQDIPDLVAYARAIQSQLTEAQAEIERLRDVLVKAEKVLSLYRHFEKSGDGKAYLYQVIDIDLAKSLEKARQPK